MTSIDLSTILADGDYLKREAGTLVGDTPTGGITSATVTTLWTGTTAAYNAITTKDPATLYVVTA